MLHSPLWDSLDCGFVSLWRPARCISWVIYLLDSGVKCMWKINGHPRLFKTLMSLQVLGWVFSTWSLMVEVCHLLVMNTFSGVFDRNLSPGFLYDGSRTLTFSAAECLGKYILFKVKRIVDYEGNIKVVHTACAVHTFNPVFNCEVASGGKEICNISCVIQFSVTRIQDVIWWVVGKFKPWIHSQCSEFLQVSDCHLHRLKCSLVILILNWFTWKQATPETTTIAHN